MPFVKTFTHLFRTRSDTNAPEIRAYISGLLQSGPKAKNLERMEEHVPDFNDQGVHHTMAHAPWDYRPVMDEVAKRADELLGAGPRVRLVGDDTGMQKKGDGSVGVARQYLGRLGKIDNGQIAVCTSLASGQSSTLTDVRLYLPEAWCDHPTRCDKARIPDDQRHFRSKPQLLLESIRHQRQLGIRFDVVSVDSGYGSHPSFLHELDHAAETFVAEVHCNQRLWTENPWPHTQSKRPGKTLAHPKASHPSQRADTWAAAQSDPAWQRLKTRDSDQGWVEVNYLAERIYVVEADRVKVWWLLAWENPDERNNDGTKPPAPRRHYALSNAPADEDPRVLVADGLGRNVVERNFREAKTDVGMADYQMRGWLGWHHHMSLVMLAMLFLLQEKMHSPEIATAEGPVKITSGDIRFILERLLPTRAQAPCDEAEVRKMLEKRLANRVKDQLRRRAKTRSQRPPLMPDEDIQSK